MTTTGYTPRLAVRDVDGRPVCLPGVPPLVKHRRAYPVEVAIRRTEIIFGKADR